MGEEGLVVHYWELPADLFISLKPEFHQKLCLAIQEKLKDKHKNCLFKILNCPKWHAQRLFTQFNRMTIAELEKLRVYSGINGEDVEANIETLGNHEDGTIIKNPKLPFQMKDLVYVTSHLMFDGSYRDKKGCYFYAYEPSLVEYHKKRLNAFGEVPINLVEGENQLYFSYTMGYIASKILEIETFKSTKAYLSDKIKSLAKENKSVVDEIIKALIVDEGDVEDKVRAELANKILVKDICEVSAAHYPSTKITSRTRTIDFKENPAWTHTTTSWNINFSASCFKELYKSLSPLPIGYKEERFKFLSDRQSKSVKRGKNGETKRSIVSLLLESPKTMDELAKQLLVKQTTIRAHLKGHPNCKDSLISLGLVDKIDGKILRRGGYAKVGVYGIIDINKANGFLSK